LSQKLSYITWFMMKQALIFGGTGFIGRHLVKSLATQGVYCRVVIHKQAPGELSDLPLVEYITADISQPESLTGLAQDVDTVYNLCGTGHVTALSEQAYQKFYQVNVTGVKNLAESCANYPIERFIHFSSTAAVGPICSQAIDESVTPHPITPYQRSKYQGELILAQIHAATGLPAVILRPCMVYGPGGKGEFLKLCRLMGKGLFPRAGLGDNLTPIVYVDDVVSGAILAGKHGRPGEIYFVASERSPEMALLQQLVTKAMGVWRPYWYTPLWLLFAGAALLEAHARWRKRVPLVTPINIRSTINSRVFRIDKAQRELGYTPKMPLEEGIARTVRWYQDQGYL
jgi:nucleoside-diphosphate-sugar epimerase